MRVLGNRISVVDGIRLDRDPAQPRPLTDIEGNCERGPERFLFDANEEHYKLLRAWNKKNKDFWAKQ
jgi:hypothetical protein